MSETLELMVNLEGDMQCVLCPEDGTMRTLKDAVAEVFRLDVECFEVTASGVCVSTDLTIPLCELQYGLLEVCLSDIAVARKELAALDIHPDNYVSAAFQACTLCAQSAPSPSSPSPSPDEPRSILRHLLQCCPDVFFASGAHGRTPFSLLAGCGETELVCEVLSAADESTQRRLLNTQDLTQSAPVNHAVAAGHLETLKVLKEAGAVMEWGDMNGCTLVHRAVEHGQVAVLQQLIEWDLPLTTPDNFRARPVHYSNSCAVGRGAEVLECLYNAVLQEFGEEQAQRLWQVRDGQGFTVLQQAARSQQGDIAHFALTHGADPLNRGGSVLYPIHEAAYTGNVAVLEHLLAFGVNVECRDTDDRTALHWAVLNAIEQHVDPVGPDLGTIRFLLARGASTDSADSDGITPRQLAEKRKGENTYATMVVEFFDVVAEGLRRHEGGEGGGGGGGEGEGR